MTFDSNGNRWQSGGEGVLKLRSERRPNRARNLPIEARLPRGRVPLASYFVPTMHRATPGTRTLPSFSNALTFAMAFARIRSRAGSSTC